MRRLTIVLCMSMLLLNGCRGTLVTSSEGEALEASGIIQAEQVLIASEFGGLVA